MDKHSPGRGDGDTDGEVQGSRVEIVFTATGRDLKEHIERCARAWPVGGETDTSTGQSVYPCKRNLGKFSATSTVLPQMTASTGTGGSPC